MSSFPHFLLKPSGPVLMLNFCLINQCHPVILLLVIHCILTVSVVDAANASPGTSENQVSVQDFGAIPEHLTSAEEAEIDRMVLPVPRNWVGDFNGIRERNFIRILVPYSKSFYSVDRGVERGIDYDLGKALEAWLQKKYPSKKKNQPLLVVFIPVQRDQLLPELMAGKGDIAAGGLTVTEGRMQVVEFVTPFVNGVREALVTAPGIPMVENLEDMGGMSVTIRGSSSYYEHLTALNIRLTKQGMKPIAINKADEWLEAEDLLEMVNAGLIEATVVDRYLARIWQPLFTEMRINDSFYVKEGGDLAWAIRKGSPELRKVMDSFMKEHMVGTTFGNIMVKRHVHDQDRVLNATSEEELRKFKNLVDFFKLYGGRYNFDYLMLVAQGYQESMLNQKARSHMGAVGIMQLLPATAADPAINIQGIDKDAGKNIEAGAKYLRLLTDKYLNDPELDSVNRMLMAFAAYNAGPGNLRKFRRLAEKSGHDPNIWFQNVEHAAARITGQETVKYVANIYKYYLAYKLSLKVQQPRQSQQVLKTQ